jgi:two-component system CheB/CheR fusion protein
VKIARYPYVHLEKAAGIPPDEKSLSRIFFLLRNRTGHDFTYYKHNTIVRRIRRRMLLHKIKKIQDYVRYLQNTPVEIDELFEDILINVTGFFRDQETFEKLKEKVFPQLFKGRSAEEPVRIWVPGCSTGEEAYSIAIALTEFLNGKWSSIPIQIFATDINEKSVNKARAGIYSENIVSDVSSTRLQRYFTQVPGGYQINKLIRDMCVFAVQDVIKDPPFSKLDLVCCRNLLIYLDRDLQKKVLSILHFALNPHGFLLLGTSETVGASADLFSLVDKKVKIYSKKFVSIPIPREITAVPAAPLDFLPAPGKYEKPGRDLHAEAVQFLLERYGPPAVIIDDHMEIVAFSGKTGPYIEPSPGTVSLKLLKMARQDLIADLRAIAFKAIKSNAAARKDNIPFHHNGEKHALNILVTPLQGQKASQRFFAVVFEPAITAPEPSRPKVKIKPDEKDRRIDELEQELLTTREQMQSIINDQITTNEELQTANEEIQSANEEMQSTNEELESAKEELQSTNEELVTVNDELENRNIELGRVNNDLTNLLSSVEIPMVMLSDDLRIRHFTPLAKDLLNLIDTDVGRPITDLKPKINVHNLDRMVSEVINTIRSKAIEAQDEDGHWYSVQIRPYKTTDNRIEGAVLVFIDITDVKQDPEQVHLAAAIMRDSNDAITVQDLEGRILAWNKGAHRMYGYTETEARKMTIWDLVPDNAREAELQLTKRLTAGEAVTSFETLRRTKDGRILDVWLTVSGIRDRTGKIASIASTERDITEIKRNLERVRRLAAVVNDSNDAILVHDFDGNIQAWNSRAEQLYGYTEAQALKMNVLNMISDGQREDYLRCMKRLQAGETIDSFETQRNNKDGQAIAVIVRVTLLVDDAGQPKAIATTERAVKAS